MTAKKVLERMIIFINNELVFASNNYDSLNSNDKEQELEPVSPLDIAQEKIDVITKIRDEIIKELIQGLE